MNSLSMEHWKSWHIRTVFNGVGRLPYYITSGPGETHFVTRLRNSVQEVQQSYSVEECDATNDTKEIIKLGKKNQLFLF